MCRFKQIAAVALTLNVTLRGQAPSSTTPPVAIPADLPTLSDVEQARMDQDLLEITIAQLQALYAKGKYTITDVTRWYMGRIQKYNGIYRAVQTVDVGGALQTAGTEDADKRATHGPLWGVPVAIKANTAVKGLVNTDGWESSAIPGHELIAPKDATVVAKLRPEQ
jgi:aspartyl-tRNA(Asn)/glutamyl-tRNA(Gln) amidotransferase subunit A